MFARVTHIETLRSKIDDAIAIYRDSVVPAAKQQKGFVSTYLLSDRKTGKIIAFVLWDTEADMMVNEASGYYHQQLDKFKDISVKPPTREHYEVTVEA
jgi:heme-degrading monooxygenase HmoA